MNRFASTHRVIVALAFLLIISGCGRTRAEIPDGLSETRFVKLESGAIYDAKTDMAWYIGPDKDMNWYEAVIWVYNLRDDNERWRMPLLNELTYLYESLKINESGKKMFLNNNYNWLWSGSFPGCSNDFFPACVMFFGDGGYTKINPYFSSERRVFAVHQNPFNK